LGPQIFISGHLDVQMTWFKMLGYCFRPWGIRFLCQIVKIPSGYGAQARQNCIKTCQDHHKVCDVIKHILFVSPYPSLSRSVVSGPSWSDIKHKTPFLETCKSLLSSLSANVSKEFPGLTSCIRIRCERFEVAYRGFGA
jgi:hypothetical protein